LLRQAAAHPSPKGNELKNQADAGVAESVCERASPGGLRSRPSDQHDRIVEFRAAGRLSYGLSNANQRRDPFCGGGRTDLEQQPAAAVVVCCCRFYIICCRRPGRFSVRYSVRYDIRSIIHTRIGSAKVQPT
ncbi:unnamed protein product, partial [Scytosiphon promiscuus]